MAQILDSSGFDRISDLPCDIIDEILKHLPLKDAVRTCILSKEWRYRWVTIPHLDFSSANSGSWKQIWNSDSLIDCILGLYKGPLVKLSLNMYYSSRSHATLDRLLNLVSNCNTQHLKLRLSPVIYPYLMPHHVFNLDHLTNLYLAFVEIKLPLEYRGLHSLVKLDLENFYIEPEDFRNFISKCPMLESLTVCNIYGDMVYLALDFDAPPSLKSFRYWGRVDQIFRFEGASLENITVIHPHYAAVTRNPMPVSPRSDTSFTQFFGQLQSIQKLEVSFLFLKLLATHGVPQKLPKDLKLLTHIQFETLEFSMDCVASTLCLIRSSPNLLSLEIVCLESTREEAAIHYLQHELESQVPLSDSLQVVLIHTFHGSGVEMQFVKLLLLRVKSLRYLEINFWDNHIKFKVKQHLQIICQELSFKPEIALDVI